MFCPECGDVNIYFEAPPLKFHDEFDYDEFKDDEFKDDEFDFNKDAGLFVCPAGHLAIRKARTGKKKAERNKNQKMTYYFDIEKCKQCPRSEGCYKSGSKSKTYSVTIKSETHNLSSR